MTISQNNISRFSYKLVTSITLGFDLAYSTGHGVPPAECISTPLSKVVAYFHNHFTTIAAMDLSCLASLYHTVQGPELDKTIVFLFLP